MAAAQLDEQRQTFEKYRITRLNSQGKGAKLAAASKEDTYSWFQGFESHSQEQYYFQMVERAFKLVIE